MIKNKIIETYSKIHAPQTLTNDNSPSFEGSQRQSEFFKAWELIIDFYKGKDTKTITFLEVGAWKGLWGIAFNEFCKMKNIQGEYTTITMLEHDPNNGGLVHTINYIRNDGLKANLINLNTFNENALTEVKKYRDKFDIVFIDAGHKYHEAKNDIDKFAKLANDLLIFHDIRPIEDSGNCGVYQAIKDAGIILDEEISVNENEMGIGIKWIK